MLIPSEDLLNLEHIELSLADAGVDDPWDFDSHLRNDVQQTTHLVGDHLLTVGQLPVVAVAFPEVLRDCFLQLEHAGHHAVLSGTLVDRH